MATPASGHTETATPFPGGQSSPPPRSHHRSSPSVNSLTDLAKVSNPAAASPPSNSGSLRVPNPAKRVLRSPADELRSAVNRDAIRSEAKRAAQNSQPGVQVTPTPALATSPAPSPSMPATSSPAHRADPRAMVPRNPSIDSTVSSTSNVSAKVNGITTFRATDSARLEDVGSLIVDAGSPEAAILKLLSERNQAASHNAQLWRLVEKQRSMILGLNKDLEKALKEKEKYRRRAKDQLVQSESAPSLITANQQWQELVAQQGSQSPNVRDMAASVTSMSTRDISIDSRKVSDTSDTVSLTPGRSDTPLDASNAPSSTMPATPQSTESATQLLRDIQIAEAAATSAQENRVITQSPTTSPTLAHSTGSPRPAGAVHKKTPSISSAASNSTPTGSYSSPKNPVSRKAPPAPLKLSSQKALTEAAHVTNNIIDPSDSEYEDDPDSARAEQSARGRRKTREEDDRDREIAAEQESASRSLSKKDQKEKTTQASRVRDVPLDTSVSITRDLTTGKTDENMAATGARGESSEAVAIVRQQILANIPASLQKSTTTPSLLSPGLPMSPRPGDRPLNSPMPRPPNKSLNTIPMSPMSGVAGLPLSPRAPRQPIPMPPHISSSMASGHLTGAERPQGAQSLPSVIAQGLKPSPQGSPEHERPGNLIDGAPMTPGEIYQGLVTEEYPELLLPPNALPSIYIKTASSRMKPSRQSYLAPKTADDNPVFTLAVYERSKKRQLWRIEKTFVALSELDEEVKATCLFRERMPDKVLFNGHAPARIDARRAAIDAYFDRMLESITDDRPAMVICSFLSTDTIGSDANDYFGGSIDLRSDISLSQKPRREGYLTKRGKNFGGWKARYFILDGPVFKYYDTQGGAQLGSIKLQNAQIGKQSNNTQAFQEDEDNQFRHAFLILEPKKKDSTSLVRHVLCAESDEERDIWVDTLLQHVDSKEDPEDAMTKPLSSAKTNMVPPRSPRLQKSLNDLRPPSRSREAGDSKQDRLRALGYNDMIAGDAPVIGLAPQHPRPGERSASPHDGNFGPAVTPAEQSTPHPLISGPTNLQVISNTEEWGMKPPSTPQNKDKKRSIFAGLRGRSSSDLGPGERPVYVEQGHGPPVRAAFGAPLADAVEFARPANVATELPAVVYRCIEYLVAKNALAEEGIFRLSGSNTVVKGLKDRFNAEGDVDLLADGTYYDIHAVASLLKLFLRELPSSILTRELHLEFLACQEKHGREKILALNPLVNRLPRVNRALLEALSSLLLSIVSNSEVNKMNIRNVGIVFSPTLNVPGPLISAFVEDHDIIFGSPLELLESPVSAMTASTVHGLPTDLRSPRKQMFSDLPTPAYNQTSFQSLGLLGTDDTGMIPMNPTYYQVAPQGEGGFGSLNDALKTPTVYNVAASGVPSLRDTKARRRESAMLGFPTSNAIQKKTSRGQLRDDF